MSIKGNPHKNQSNRFSQIPITTSVSPIIKPNQSMSSITTLTTSQPMQSIFDTEDFIKNLKNCDILERRIKQLNEYAASNDIRQPPINFMKNIYSV